MAGTPNSHLYYSSSILGPWVDAEDATISDGIDFDYVNGNFIMFGVRGKTS